MRNHIEIAIGVCTLIGIIWEVARQYQKIYSAMARRDKAILELINNLEKRILAHESECGIRYKYHEHILNRLEEAIDSKLLNS